MIKSYLIKQCRENINDTFSILKTPGPYPGAQLNLFETLDRLLDKLETVENGSEPPTVKLKFAADGAKVSRISSFLVLSLAILNDGNEVMSSSGQHTLAIVSSDEKYFTLKESFGTIFAEINALLDSQDNGNIIYETKSQKKIKLEIFLGGGMKFLLTALGLNSANSNFACLYCKIEKKNRSDMSEPENFYWSNGMARTIDEMLKFSKKTKMNFGCLHPPLLNIEMSHVVVGELHLLMRICDVLLRNLIEDSVNLDHKNNMGKKCNSKKDSVNELVSCIRDCGVSFSIWENKVKDGRGDFLKNLEWTSLTGSDFKKLLKGLPEKLMKSNCIKDVSKPKVVNLWKDFKIIYEILSFWSPLQSDIDKFFELVKKWILDFRSLSSQLEGYDSKSVTPYMHVLVYHVPKMLKSYGSIKQFTGQGVEKSLIYHRKTNKHSATAEALRVRQRKLMLKQYARIKGKYGKTNLAFWRGGGKQVVVARSKVKSYRNVIA